MGIFFEFSLHMVPWKQVLPLTSLPRMSSVVSRQLTELLPRAKPNRISLNNPIWNLLMESKSAKESNWASNIPSRPRRFRVRPNSFFWDELSPRTDRSTLLKCSLAAEFSYDLSWLLIPQSHFHYLTMRLRTKPREAVQVFGTLFADPVEVIAFNNMCQKINFVLTYTTQTWWLQNRKVVDFRKLRIKMVWRIRAQASYQRPTSTICEKFWKPCSLALNQHLNYNKSDCARFG